MIQDASAPDHHTKSHLRICAVMFY